MSLADKIINTNQITTVGVQSLTDRPNQPLEYGGNALKAKELKIKFDALPTMIIEAFNKLVEYLGTEAFASDLKTSDKDYTTLAALVAAIRNGGFANILKVSAEKNQTLKEFSASVENGTLADNLQLVFGDKVHKGLMEAIRDGTLADRLQIDVDDTLQEGKESLTGFCSDLLESFIDGRLAKKILIINDDVPQGKTLLEIAESVLKIDGKVNLTDGDVLVVNCKAQGAGSVSSIALVTVNNGGGDVFNDGEDRYYKAYGLQVSQDDNGVPILRHGRGCVIEDLEDGTRRFKFGNFTSNSESMSFEKEDGKLLGEPSLLLDTEEEQTVQGDVKFNKDINILGNLTVSGKQTVLNTESLTVDHRYIVCNYNGVAGLQTGFAMLTGNRDMVSDGQREFYPAYGIIYDPESESVRLGRGYVTISNELDYEDYTPLFKFGYVEQNDYGIVEEHEESGQAIATRSDSGDIPNGNFVVWDDVKKCLVDAGVSPANIDAILSAFDTEEKPRLNLFDPTNTEQGKYGVNTVQGVLKVTKGIDKNYMRNVSPIQIPSGSTKLYVSTDIQYTEENAEKKVLIVLLANESGEWYGSLTPTIREAATSYLGNIPAGATHFYISVDDSSDEYTLENFCVSVTEGFEKYNPIKAPVALKKEFLPSDLGVVNPTVPNGNLVKWDAEQNKLVDAQTSLNFFAPERVAQKGQFLFINTEKGSESYSKAMAGIVFTASSIYDGADNNVQDGYAIVYDPKTKTLRLGTGQIGHSRDIYTGEGEIDFSYFEFGSDGIYENEMEDEAIATRADSQYWENNHIPQWDSERNMFVDSGVSLGDISSALDELHAYALYLTGGGKPN